MLNSVGLVIVSFFASLGFGLVFRIVGWDLLLAGLAGALTRIVYLLLLSVIPSRIVYMSLAALFAGLYGELLATIRKEPSTYFIYPALVPLIPGDLLYYTLMGIISGGMDVLWYYSIECVLALSGLSIGFVISSTIAHYMRRYHFFHEVVFHAFTKRNQKILREVQSVIKSNEELEKGR